MNMQNNWTKTRKILTFYKGNPENALTGAYIVALGLIAVLTICGHILTYHITYKQQEVTKIAYEISRQRALIQRIRLYASLYHTNGAKLDHYFLTQAIQEMEEGRTSLDKTLKTGGALGGPISEALTKAYFEDPFFIDKNIGQYASDAKNFSDFSNLAGDTPERMKFLESLSGEPFDSLSHSLDLALESYQEEASKKTALYYMIQTISMFVILLVLLLEAMFIFSPLVLRLKDYHRTLVRRALEDFLTGLNNRLAFTQRASAEIKRAEREGTIFAVVLCDLDHFKSVNDTYGHQVGDLVLKHFTALMQKSLRAGDIIGRIGGEEFAVLLPRTTSEKAFQTIDRLRAMVAETPCPFENETGEKLELSYTGSFGVIIVSDTRWNIEQLLNQADINLYEAKNQGRNKVIISPAREYVPAIKK